MDPILKLFSNLLGLPVLAVSSGTAALHLGLRALGVAPGDRVATLSWNNYQHLEAYFGIPQSGGVLHTNAGATRDAISFQPDKLAPRLYQITLPASAGSGEYGLLAPGTTTGSNKQASGKIYTVSIAQ